MTTQDFQQRDNQQPAPGRAYKAIFAQSSTSAPTATVLYNSIGSAATIARSGTGVYTLTLSGATWGASADQFFATLCLNGAAVTGTVVRISSTVVTLNFGDAATPSAADSGAFSLEIQIFE